MAGMLREHSGFGVRAGTYPFNLTKGESYGLGNRRPKSDLFECRRKAANVHESNVTGCFGGRRAQRVGAGSFNHWAQKTFNEEREVQNSGFSPAKLNG